MNKRWIILSVILLIIFAGTYYATRGPELTIENLPGITDLQTQDVNQPIFFTFLLENTGHATASVQPIEILLYNAEGTILPGPVATDPAENFTLDPGEKKEITVGIAAPMRKTEAIVSIGITYDNDQKVSATAPMRWGFFI